MELLQMLLLFWSLSLPAFIHAQQTQPQTKCTSSLLSGIAAYNDCCPGVGTAPVTLNGKRYKVICGKEIKFNTTPIWKTNPISCTQVCDANPDCVSAYWTDTFGGICTVYTTVAVAAGTNSVSLVPIPSDDQECNRKITAAEQAECQRCQNLKICPTLDCSTCPAKPCPKTDCSACPTTPCPKTDCSTCPTTPCPKTDCSTCPTKPCPKIEWPGKGGKKPGTGGKKPGTGGKKPGTGGKKPGTGGRKPGGRTPIKPTRPIAPSISGCGAGSVHGPYAGNSYYASYVGCTGQGAFNGALRISSNQQQMDVCVQMCLRSPGCVMAIREHAASTGMASRCSMKSSRGATFAKGDNDLILKI